MLSRLITFTGRCSGRDRTRPEPIADGRRIRDTLGGEALQPSQNRDPEGGPHVVLAALRSGLSFTDPQRSVKGPSLPASHVGFAGTSALGVLKEPPDMSRTRRLVWHPVPPGLCGPDLYNNRVEERLTVPELFRAEGFVFLSIRYLS